MSINSPIMKTPKYMEQELTELKGQIDNSTLFEDFNTILSIMDRTNKGLTWPDYLNSICQLNLIDTPPNESRA